MSTTIHSPFKASPRISREGFVLVLDRAGSYESDPLWGPYPRNARPDVARSLWDDITEAGHDPAVWLAIAGKEHTYGTNLNSVLGRNHTHSWTNARSVRHPDIEAEIITDSYRQSQYVRYHTVRDSVADGVYRVDDPTFAYQQAGATSIADVITIWAPHGDAENDPDGYARTMVSWINEWAAEFPPGEEHPVSVADHYGIRGLIDSRHQLFRRDIWNPSRRRALSEKQGKVIVHYAGADQPLHLTDMQLWQSYARYHAQTGRFGSGITADGLQYHVGIGRDGSKHLLTDIELDRWHCGSWPENGTHLAINLPIGGSQRATPEALQALNEVVDDWVGDRERSQVKGHQEVDWTDCPGTLMEDFVLPYREGVVMTTEQGRWFPQTECYVGGGFWDYWINNGGLMVFGYPLTNEIEEDGRTVQYFERAVFEFHSENDEPYRVLQRRLGADALQRAS